MIRRRRPLSAFFVAAFVFGVCALGGCDGDGDCDAIEPSYAGDATDETWRVMLDARDDADDTSDVKITSPADGSDVAASEPATFSWSSSLEVATLPMTPLPSFRRRTPGLFDHVSAVIFPVAHAHQPPITSDLYFVEVDVPGRACPVAGLTTDESFVFADADWQAIADTSGAGGGERTLRILSAFVTNNVITEGPFSAAPVTFTVTE